MRNEKILPKQKVYQTDQHRFKLCVYYSHKPCGTPYSVIEKNLKKHRKYHDGEFDYVHTTEGRTVTREDLAFNKLLKHLELHKAHIDSALLFVNDFAEQKQHLIGKFFRDENRSIFIQPIFMQDEMIGHVYFSHLPKSPIETTQLRSITLKKNTA